MVFQWKDKVVLITGAASGIGALIVRKLIELENVKLDDYFSRTGVRLMAICYGVTGTSLLARSKMGTFDKVIESRMEEILSDFYSQNPDNAATGLIDAYKYGDNGSTWLSTNDQPVKDITEQVTKAYKILSDVTI